VKSQGSKIETLGAIVLWIHIWIKFAWDEVAHYLVLYHVRLCQYTALEINEK